MAKFGGSMRAYVTAQLASRGNSGAEIAGAQRVLQA